MVDVETYAAFKEAIANKHGFVMAHRDGTIGTGKKIQAETKATIRCIPLDVYLEAGICIYSGKPSKQRVVFAQAY
jgi:prolyl-tRNA synthetase